MDFLRASMRAAVHESSAQLVHAAGVHPACGGPAPCLPTRTPCEHAVQRSGGGVAGSHSSRPHSSPTLIMQERQSFCHMANGTLQALKGRNL